MSTPWWKIILEVLTAVGTVGAVGAALWLGLRNEKCRLYAAFLWGETEQNAPTLLIQNIGNRLAVIERLVIEYDGKEICKLNVLYEPSLAECAIIHANDVIKMHLSAKSITLPEEDNSEMQTKKKWLKIKIYPRHGTKHVTKNKYSRKELTEFLWGYYLKQEL